MAIDTSITNVLGEFINKAGWDENQASLFAAKRLTDIKAQHPNATPEEIDAFSAALGDALKSGIRGSNITGSEARDPQSQETAQAQGNFENFFTNVRAQEYERNVDQYKQTQAENAVAGLGTDISVALNLIDNNPNNTEVVLGAFEQTARKAIEAAGLGEDFATKYMGGIRKQAIDAEATSLVNRDPEGFLKKFEADPARYGAKGLVLKYAAEDRIAKAGAEAQKAQFEQSKAEVFGLPAAVLRERAAGGDKAASAALIDLESDPVATLLSNQIIKAPLNINDPSSFLARADEVGAYERAFGETSRLLSNSNVKNLQGALTNASKSRALLGTLSQLPAGVRNRIGAELDDGPRSFAVVIADKPEVAKAMLAGATMGSFEVNVAEQLPLFPMNPALNKQANEGIKALINTDKYGTDMEEVAKKALNIVNVGGGLFGGGYPVMLPKGMSKGQFEDSADRLLASPDNMIKFGNGKPRASTADGKPVEFDPDAWQFETVAPGKYALKDENGAYAETEDGRLYVANLEKLAGTPEAAKSQNNIFRPVGGGY
jgi:hypothetical protein